MYDNKSSYPYCVYIVKRGEKVGSYRTMKDARYAARQVANAAGMATEIREHSTGLQLEYFRPKR